VRVSRTPILVVVGLILLSQSGSPEGSNLSKETRKATSHRPNISRIVLRRPIRFKVAKHVLTQLGAPVVEITHAGDEVGGFSWPTGISASRSMRLYKSALKTLGLNRVRITGFALSGEVSHRTTARVVPTKFKLTTSSERDSFGSGRRGRGNVASAPLLMSTDGSRQSKEIELISHYSEPSPAAGTEWVPEVGLIETKESGNPNFPRLIHNEMTWSFSDGSATFGDWAYEHNFKQWNPLVTDAPEINNDPFTYGRPFCPVPAQANDFWADRGGAVWSTSYPAEARPYLDSEWGDSCKKMDYTIGMYWPKFLQPGARYSTDILSIAGDASSSQYYLQAEVSHKSCNAAAMVASGWPCSEPPPCDFSPYCVGDDPSFPGRFVFLVGTDEDGPSPYFGSAPQCMSWRYERTSSDSTFTPCYDRIIKAGEPVGYWRLGETSGPTMAFDSSGNGLNGNFGSGISLGRQGAVRVTNDTSAGFSGVGGVRVPSSTLLNASTLSAEAWIRTTLNDSATCSTPRGIVGRSGVFTLGMCQNKAHASVTVGGTRYGVQGSAALNDGRWHHVAMSYDASVLRLFVDGVEAGTYAKTGALSSATTELQVGIRDQYFYGDIDEVALYNRALTATDFEQRFSHRWTLQPGCDGGSTYANLVCDSNPIGFWRLGESAGTNADDNTNVQNGTYQTGVTLGRAGGIAADNDTSVGFNGNGGVTIAYEPYGTYALDKLSAEGWFRTTLNDLQTSCSSPTATPRGIIGRTGTFTLGTCQNKAHATITVGGTKYVVVGSTVLNDGRWHHVAMTYDGTELRLFVDGLLEGSPLAVSGVLSKSQSALQIGIRDQYFYGDIDEVALYNRALTATEVQDHSAWGAS
jgi:hypothetical protein